MGGGVAVPAVETAGSQSASRRDSGLDDTAALPCLGSFKNEEEAAQPLPPNLLSSQQEHQPTAQASSPNEADNSGLSDTQVYATAPQVPADDDASRTITRPRVPGNDVVPSVMFWKILEKPGMSRAMEAVYRLEILVPLDERENNDQAVAALELAADKALVLFKSGWSNKSYPDVMQSNHYSSLAVRLAHLIELKDIKRGFLCHAEVQAVACLFYDKSKVNGGGRWNGFKDTTLRPIITINQPKFCFKCKIFFGVFFRVFPDFNVRFSFRVTPTTTTDPMTPAQALLHPRKQQVYRSAGTVG